jgi:hypothetical protein
MMNRRGFLTTLLAAPLAAFYRPKTDLFFEPTKLHGAPVVSDFTWDKTRIDFFDKDQWLYAKLSEEPMNIVSSKDFHIPLRITNIEVPEGY